jgi:hypothetical protein
MTGDAYDDLSEECERALDALQEKRPAAKLVATQGGDWAYVSIGRVRVTELAPEFTKPDDGDNAVGIVRIPTNFPNGNPYGVVIVPPLEHADDDGFPDQDVNHQNAQPVLDALDDVEDVGWVSCRWRHVTIEEPEDLRKAPEVVRGLLREVAQNA